MTLTNVKQYLKAGCIAFQCRLEWTSVFV